MGLCSPQLITEAFKLQTYNYGVCGNCWHTCWGLVALWLPENTVTPARQMWWCGSWPDILMVAFWSLSICQVIVLRHCPPDVDVANLSFTPPKELQRFYSVVPQSKQQRTNLLHVYALISSLLLPSAALDTKRSHCLVCLNAVAEFNMPAATFLLSCSLKLPWSRRLQFSNIQ